MRTSFLVHTMSWERRAAYSDSVCNISVGAAEAAVVESLSTYVRCCIATCGGGIGAAARSACWRHLHGAVTIWLGNLPMKVANFEPVLH